MESTAIVQRADDTEQQLIDRAIQAEHQAAWIVGECAHEWTQRFARGRGDQDFGDLVGLSQQQVNYRRLVWAKFGSYNSGCKFPSLTWSHYRQALSWEDAEECLAWAAENDATVAEMRVWRLAKHGESLRYRPTPAANLTADDVPEPDDSPLVRPSIRKVTPETTKRPADPGPQRATPASPARVTAQNRQAVQELAAAESADDAIDRALNEIARRVDEATNAKKLAAKFRKLADKLDPPRSGNGPSLEEVEEYAAEQGWQKFDAMAFWSHYELTNWTYGKQKRPLTKWHIAASQAWKNGTGWAVIGSTHSKIVDNDAAFREVFGE